MKERSSIGVGHSCMRSGAFVANDEGGNPIELHLSFVPECELTERRVKNATLQEPRSPLGDEKIGQQRRPSVSVRF